MAYRPEFISAVEEDQRNTIARLTAELADLRAISANLAMVMGKKLDDTKARAEKAERELAAALALHPSPAALQAVTAAAYEAAAQAISSQAVAHAEMALNGLPEKSRLREAMEAAYMSAIHTIRALTPADALAAQTRRDAQMRAGGMRAAAELMRNYADKIRAEERENATWGGPDPRGDNARGIRLAFAKEVDALAAQTEEAANG